MRNYTHIFHDVIICLILIQLIKPISKLSAQGEFVEGYVLTSQKDTIRGLVRDGNWATSPGRIEFKRVNHEVRVYSAEDIVGFGLVQVREIYKSKKIGVLNIDLTQTYTIAPSLIARDSVRVFLQEMVSGGRATLFQFLDHLERSHFFIEKDHELKELFYYPFYKSIGDQTYLIIYDEYKRQLSRL